MDGWLSAITEWFGSQIDIIVNWAYALVVDGFAYYVLLSLKLTYTSALFLMEFSYNVAVSIINELQFNTLINSYYSQLDTDVLGLLNMLGVPQSVNIILSSLVMKFVMGKVGVIA